MKKILFTFTLFFVCLISVNATTFYLGERVPKIYIRAVDGSKIGYDATSIIRRSDGEYVYCINPYIYANYNNNYIEYSYNNSLFNLTDEQLDKLNLISYYGYGYEGHTDLKWYAITQVLMWRELNIGDIYFMDSADGNKINIYDNELLELKNMVDNYYKKPSFSDKTYNYTIGNTYEIKDLNNVLQYYDVKSSNITYIKRNNKLYITTMEPGSYEINFIKKSPVNKDYKLYYLEEAQSLLYPGKVKDIEFKINIEVIGGSITINKIDSENKERTFGTLEGAIYGLYKDNELIREINTDENGVGYIDKLQLGKYTIKEITPSLGYEIDSNVYEVELTNDNKNIIIESKENIIKGNLDIDKYYGFGNNYNKEDGAVFNIYDTSDNLIGTYETKNGNINAELDYGDYYVVQQKGIEGYSFVDKFNISIKEKKDYKFNLYDNILIVNVPNTGIYKKNNKYYLIPIILGFILIITSIKKTNFD